MKIETTPEEVAELATRLGLTTPTTDSSRDEDVETALRRARTAEEARDGALLNQATLKDALASAQSLRDSYRGRTEAHERRCEEHAEQWSQAHERGEVTQELLGEVLRYGMKGKDPGPYPPLPWVIRWCDSHPQPATPVRVEVDVLAVGRALREKREADAKEAAEDTTSEATQPTSEPTTEPTADGGVTPARFDASPVPTIPVRVLTEQELEDRARLEAAAAQVDREEREAQHAHRMQVRAEEADRAAAAVRADREARTASKPAFETFQRPTPTPTPAKPTPKPVAPRRGPLPKRVGDPGADKGDGLDIWRCDGRALYNTARTTLVAQGRTYEQAMKEADAFTDRDYAVLAERLVEFRADGRVSDPLAALAAITGKTSGGINSALVRAARRGILAGGARGGVRGNAVRPHNLTDYARSLLTGDADAPPRTTATDEAAAVDPVLAEEEPDATPELRQLAYNTEPTPAQQAAIDQLTDEGKAIVDRLRNGPRRNRGPQASLPLNVVPVTNRSLHKDLRRAAGDARRKGWAIGIARSGHMEWYGPKGQRVTTASTPGTQGTITQAQRALRAVGLDV